MKHRVFLIVALFVCAFASSALCSSCKTGMVALIDIDDNFRAFVEIWINSVPGDRNLTSYY